jgi:hypothetical protein
MNINDLLSCWEQFRNIQIPCTTENSQYFVLVQGGSSDEEVLELYDNMKLGG